MKKIIMYAFMLISTNFMQASEKMYLVGSCLQQSAQCCKDSCQSPLEAYKFMTSTSVCSGAGQCMFGICCLATCTLISCCDHAYKHPVKNIQPTQADNQNKSKNLRQRKNRSVESSFMDREF